MKMYRMRNFNGMQYISLLGHEYHNILCISEVYCFIIIYTFTTSYIIDNTKEMRLPITESFKIFVSTNCVIFLLDKISQSDFLSTQTDRSSRRAFALYTEEMWARWRYSILVYFIFQSQVNAGIICQCNMYHSLPHPSPGLYN